MDKHRYLTCAVGPKYENNKTPSNLDRLIAGMTTPVMDIFQRRGMWYVKTMAQR